MEMKQRPRVFNYRYKTNARGRVPFYRSSAGKSCGRCDGKMEKVAWRFRVGAVMMDACHQCLGKLKAAAGDFGGG